MNVPSYSIAKRIASRRFWRTGLVSLNITIHHSMAQARCAAPRRGKRAETLSQQLAVLCPDLPIQARRPAQVKDYVTATACASGSGSVAGQIPSGSFARKPPHEPPRHKKPAARRASRISRSGFSSKVTRIHSPVPSMATPPLASAFCFRASWFSMLSQIELSSG